MGRDTKIGWTHGPNGEPGFSFNPWVGCQKISPGCAHCYAESWAKRSGMVEWGGARRRTSEANWKEPLRWNLEALRTGRRYRVFCSSLADVFDNEVPASWRSDLFDLIEATPFLDWLLLTKRIGNVLSMISRRWAKGAPANVWIGATVVTQGEADRDIPKLLDVPARLRFLSIEPMLELIVIDKDLVGRLDWIIIGGESGSRRTFDLGDAYGLVHQCRTHGVPVYVKQMGARPVLAGEPLKLRDPKGEDWAEWPSLMRVRQHPAAPLGPILFPPRQSASL